MPFIDSTPMLFYDDHKVAVVVSQDINIASCLTLVSPQPSPRTQSRAGSFAAASKSLPSPTP